MTTAKIHVSYAWRYGVLLLVLVGSFVFLMSQHRLPQDPQYHNFADRRPFFGIPNFAAIPFLVVGNRSGEAVKAGSATCEQ